MRVEIGFNLNSLQEAAQYILDHNPSVPKWPNPPKNFFDLMRQMKDRVYRDVRKNIEVLKREKAEGVVLTDDWVSMTGTGGYIIQYSLEDHTDELIYISVDFLVDPAVGQDSTFVSEEIDFDEETVFK
jgi:hypothetical protein